MKPIISVIIPTYHDWERLRLCIDALAKQSYPAERFEVIIVNNDPADPVPVNFVLPGNFELITEATPGSYAARNAAIKIATGCILAFTDSDCIPDKDWLKNAYRYFKEKDAERIGGNVKILYQDPESKTAAELYESMFSFNQKKNVEQHNASITANFFAKREHFQTVGFFDSGKKSGEDFGWNRRANRYDIRLIYAGDVIVGHPARRSVKELAKKGRRVFGGKKRFDFKSLKGIAKEAVYIPYLFFVQVFPKVKRIFLSDSELTLTEKFKVIYVILVLYVNTVIEYFRLLVGNKTQR